MQPALILLVVQPSLSLSPMSQVRLIPYVKEFSLGGQRAEVWHTPHATLVKRCGDVEVMLRARPALVTLVISV
jgi:hypothetical protein